MLFGVGVCCLAASLGGYAGMSPVFGAFCAGLALRHTTLRKPVGRALVSSLITPQIGEFSFILVASGVASGIFVGGEVDFLFAVIAASLFLSPIWSGVLHYLLVRYRIHDPHGGPPVEPASH